MQSTLTQRHPRNESAHSLRRVKQLLSLRAHILPTPRLGVMHIASLVPLCQICNMGSFLTLPSAETQTHLYELPASSFSQLEKLHQNDDLQMLFDIETPQGPAQRTHRQRSAWSWGFRFQAYRRHLVEAWSVQLRSEPFLSGRRPI